MHKWLKCKKKAIPFTKILFSNTANCDVVGDLFYGIEIIAKTSEFKIKT